MRLLVNDTLSTALLDDYEQHVEQIDTSIDLMLQDGGLGGARELSKVAEFMAVLQMDSGITWKHIVREQAKRMAQIPEGERRITWQIGNEISAAAVSKAYRLWSGEDSATVGEGIDYDNFIIPMYVEYNLAPSVEAIDSASVDVFGEPNRIRIACGSLTNATSSKAREWLDSLMNYTVEGLYAPTLKGKKVSELVDMVTVHYTGAGSSALNELKEQFLNRDRIKAVWSTEEVGIRAAEGGKGAVKGLLVTARYLEWWMINSLTPDQWRTNYYGWNTGPVGTKLSEALSDLYGFIGPAGLRLPDTGGIDAGNPGLETHAFITSDSAKGLLFVSFQQSKPSLDTVAIMDTLFFSGADWANVSNITVMSYSPVGRETVPVVLETNAERKSIIFPEGYTVGSDRMLVANLIFSDSGGGVAMEDSDFAMPLDSFGLNAMPNPFNPTVQLSFQAPFKGIATLAAFSIAGVKVAEWTIGCGAGEKQMVEWNTSKWPSGCYLFMIKINAWRASRRLTLIK
jgi:hypothetical protein